MSEGDLFAGMRSGFAEQFELDGDRLLYRAGQVGPAILVSPDEQARFTERFMRHAKCWAAAAFIAWLGVVVVVIAGAVRMPWDATLVIGTVGVLALHGYGSRWLADAPKRALRGRLAVHPARKERPSLGLHAKGMERSLELFEAQFTKDGDDFLYRRAGVGPAYRVSAAERDQFGIALGRVLTKRQSWPLSLLMLLMLGGAVAVIVFQYSWVRVFGFIFIFLLLLSLPIVVQKFSAWSAPEKYLCGRRPIFGQLPMMEAAQILILRASAVEFYMTCIGIFGGVCMFLYADPAGGPLTMLTGLALLASLLIGLAKWAAASRLGRSRSTAPPWLRPGTAGADVTSWSHLPESEAAPQPIMP